MQHWWLPRTGAGVRTMISDDVVWLAYAVHRYVTVTGDAALLDEQLPFIEGERWRRASTTPSSRRRSRRRPPASTNIARAALDLAIKRTGASGLPLILGGDWNDGMNRVGEGGKGESVWLGWFLLKTLGNFAAVRREARAMTRRAKAWAKHADRLKQALETVGLGRRMVSARQFRRRHAARFARIPTSAGSIPSRSPGA